MRGVELRLRNGFIRSILAGLVFIFLTNSANFVKAAVASNHRSVDSLINEGFISANFVSLGGFQGNCVEASLENRTGNLVYVLIEAGRRLIAEDSSCQDIFIVKDNKVKLEPWAKLKTNIFGFCCISSNSAPKAKMKFAVGYMAPPDWLRLAQFINASNFDNSTIQSAVWCISNNHSISSVFGKPEALVKALKDTLGAIKKIPVPWYTTTYESSSTSVFSGNPERISGRFNYYIKHHGHLVVAIKNKNGTTVKVLSEFENQGQGSFEYQFDLNVKGWTKGEYHIVVYEDYATVLANKSFKIE